MSRWWASADESRKMLDLVDDSDIEQGVGTAVLAYHGLAAGALEPLTRRTLMDVSAVRHALADVDLQPVAKAMAAATSPIMGDAAQRYGELMAADLHKRATESTERLLLSFTNAGMAWPTAVERVATVHGVPLERLGQAATKLGAPALMPLVRADLGDRALMDYAMHMGVLENTTETVSKAQQEQFDPSEHPRGAKGRFVATPDRQEPSGDQELRDRRKRRLRRAGNITRGKDQANARRTKAADVQQAAEPTSSLAGMAGMIRGLFAPEEQAERRQSLQDRLRGERKAARSSAPQQAKPAGKPVGKPQEPQGNPLHKPITASEDAYRIEGERVALVPRMLLDAALKAGFDGTFSGNLEDSLGHSLVWMDHETVMDELVNYQKLDPRSALDYALIAIDGDFVTDDGGRRDHAISMARSAQLEVRGGPLESLDPYDYMHDFKVSIPGHVKHPNPAFREAQDRHLPMLHIRTANAKAFGSGGDDGPPLPYDKYGLHKASYQFRENEVRRDARGRFDNEPHGSVPGPVDELRARRKRRLKRQRYVANVAARRATDSGHPVGTAREEEAPVHSADVANLREMFAPEQAPQRQKASLQDLKRAERQRDARDPRRQAEAGRRRNAGRNTSAQAPDLAEAFSFDIPMDVYQRLTATADGRRLDNVDAVATALGGQEIGFLTRYSSDKATGMRPATAMLASPGVTSAVVPFDPTSQPVPLTQAQEYGERIFHQARTGAQDEDVYDVDALLGINDAVLALSENGSAKLALIPVETKRGTLYRAGYAVDTKVAPDNVRVVASRKDMQMLMSGAVPDSFDTEQWKLGDLRQASGLPTGSGSDALITVLHVKFGNTGA